MARGDRLHFRFDVDFMFLDPRFCSLPPSARWLYTVLWGCAVEAAREQLPYTYDTRTLHVRSGQDTRTLQKGIKLLQQKCLIGGSIEDGLIVYGVRDKHPRLKWKDAPYGEITNPVQGIEIEREIEEEYIPPLRKNKLKDKVPYREILDLFHEHCPGLSRVQRLSDSRRKKISGRFSELGSLEKFTELFKIVQSTPFLLGDNDRGWKASFDWLIKNDQNWVKVMEGNYRRDVNGKNAGGILSKESRDEFLKRRAEEFRRAEIEDKARKAEFKRQASVQGNER